MNWWPFGKRLSPIERASRIAALEREIDYVRAGANGVDWELLQAFVWAYAAGDKHLGVMRRAVLREVGKLLKSSDLVDAVMLGSQSDELEKLERQHAILCDDEGHKYWGSRPRPRVTCEEFDGDDSVFTKRLADQRCRIQRLRRTIGAGA